MDYLNNTSYSQNISKDRERHIMSITGHDVECIGKASQQLLHSPNEDGGWGLTVGQASSIVNTAEALSVIRMHGRPLETENIPVIKSAISYLTRNVSLHAKPRKDGGRGENVRYVSFALLGMLQYPEYISNNTLSAIEWCIQWLNSKKNSDGWPETVSMVDTSLGQTSIIVNTLCLLCGSLPSYAISEENNNLVRKLIRHGLVSISRHRRLDGWWPFKSFAKTAGSPTKTSLAVSALIAARSVIFNGDDELNIGGALSSNPVKVQVDEIIRDSVLKLEAEYPRWINHMEDDREVPGTDWKDPAYAAAAWACINGGIAPDSSEAIVKAFKYMRSLWSEDQQLWCDTPRSKGTLRSTFHIVRALNAAQLRKAGRMLMPEIKEHRVFVSNIEFDGKTLKATVPTGLIRVHLGEQMMKLLNYFVEQQNTDVSARDIAAVTGISHRNVAQYVSRLNENVRRQSGEYISPLVKVRRGRGSKYKLRYGIRIK